MRGRRPYPIPGLKPGRWLVYKMRGLPETATPGWMVSREHCGGGVSFPTWREAQDYADRMARTREVVLPRPSSIQLATIAPAKEGDKPAFVFPHTPKGVAVVANGPFFIPYDQCGLIGTALLALAEREKA